MQSFFTHVQVHLRIAQSRVYGSPQRAANMMLRLIPVAVAKYLVSRHATRIDQMNGEHFSVQVIDQVKLRLLVSGTRLLLTHFEQFLKGEHVIVE